jgi:hypothetical protein
MRINLKVSLMLVFFVAAICAKGQLQYQKGYVVTLTKDTIYGLIKDRGEIVNAKLCQFKKEPKADVVTYTAEEILAYKFINGKAYRAMEVFKNDKYQMAFVEVLIEGKVNLYHFWNRSVMNYFIEKENGKPIGLLNELYTVKKPAEDFFSRAEYKTFQIETYKDSLDSLFKGCKDLEQKINDVEYEVKPLMQLTKAYLKCTYDDATSITYEKDLRLARPSIGFFSGVQLAQAAFLSSSIRSNASISSPVGFLVNLPMPKITERLSFQAELIYNRLKFDQGFNNLPSIYTDINIQSSKIGLPLLLKYRFGINKFLPYIGVGKEFAFNFNSAVNTVPIDIELSDEFQEMERNYRKQGFYVYHAQKGGWFFDLGADYKVAPAVTIFTSLRLQSNLNLMIEEKYLDNFRFYLAEELNKLNNPHSNIFRTNSATLYLGVRF